MNISNLKWERKEHKACPLCAQERIKLVQKAKDFKFSKQEFEIAECQACGLIFTKNPPEEQYAGNFYEDPDYISHSDSRKGMINRLYHIARAFMLKRKRSLIEKETKGRKLLDVGSGTGYFLNEMKMNGWQVAGLEISDNARRFCEDNFGIHPHLPSDLYEGKIEPGFDVISLWHVLEHIYDPEGYLRIFHKLLNQNGLLVLALPNSKSLDAQHYQDFWAGYDVPRHLWHFSPETIISLLKKHHFALHRSYKMPLDGYYVSMLSESYKSPGSFGLIKGFFWGLTFHLSSIFSKEKSSSLIYIFKKSI